MISSSLSVIRPYKIIDPYELAASEVDSLLRKYPSFKTQVMNKDDEENIEWERLFKKYDSAIMERICKAEHDQSELKHTAKQIFKPQQQDQNKSERHGLMMKAKQLQSELDIKDRTYLFTTYKQWYVIQIYQLQTIYQHIYKLIF